jgi:uncharacterized glyoxalase superfamily protein PhnB
MLIDWKLAGPDSRFEIVVDDVREASTFYRHVLGTREIFRVQTDGDRLARIGLATDDVAFVVASHGQGQAAASLSRLAADFEAPFLAVMIRVDNPKRAAFSAMDWGATLVESPDLKDAVVVADPFGGHWAFITRASSGHRPQTSRRRMDTTDRPTIN